MTVHLVRRAQTFDVLVTENMFGDILSDLAGELAGSLGIAPSINASHDRAMAQAAHGSAPDIAGRDLANPTAMIGSGAMLLDWLGTRHDDAAARKAASSDRRRRCQPPSAPASAPADLGGTAGTAEFAAAVAEAIGACMSVHPPGGVGGCGARQTRAGPSPAGRRPVTCRGRCGSCWRTRLRHGTAS